MTPEQWWETEIINIKPGSIDIRGYPIEELIGSLSFAQMIWLMLRGEIPDCQHSQLLEAALVAAVDHGPQAPSIAIARMSMTCGVDINNAMASAINVLGDIHGGAGQQCMALFEETLAAWTAGRTLMAASQETLDRYQRDVSRIIPGFGHRFHPVDPRSTQLLSLLDKAVQEKTIEGKYVQIARALADELATRVKKPLPLNIDGATAIIYCELGFPVELGRGLFVLSRSVGILAHAYEQSKKGERIKGPMPPGIPYSYVGLEHHKLSH